LTGLNSTPERRRYGLDRAELSRPGGRGRVTKDRHPRHTGARPL
jgi:hypothetical protein